MHSAVEAGEALLNFSKYVISDLADVNLSFSKRYFVDSGMYIRRKASIATRF